MSNEPAKLQKMKRNEGVVCASHTTKKMKKFGSTGYQQDMASAGT
jgi:hypothetical protein